MKRTFASLLLVAVMAAVMGITVAAPVSAADALSQVWRVDTAGWNRSSSPTIADIDGDGVPEIIVGHQDGWIRVYRADGSMLPGWPQPAVMVPGQGPTPIDSSPTVADLDNNGKKEIIVSTGSAWDIRHNGGLIVFNADGSVRWRWLTGDYGNGSAGGGADGFADGMMSTPAVGDVDGDGNPDIVVGGFDLRIHAFDRFGRELPGFPFWNDDSVWSSPALYDVDHDGRLEIFIGGDSTPGGLEDWAGGVFRSLKWTPNGVVERWKQRTGEVIDSSPAIGDIDGDGRLDVIVGSGSDYHTPDSRKVWAWHLDDGSPVAGWPVATGGEVQSSPALGDLDGDGKPDVVIGSNDGKVYAFRGNGSLIWTSQLLFIDHPGGPIHAAPIVADMNGDGAPDVVVANDWGTFLINGRNGAIFGSVAQFWSSDASPAVGQFGNNWRLIVSALDTPNHRNAFFEYAMPTPGAAPPWPMFHQSPTHIAAPPSGYPPPVCPATVPNAPAPLQTGRYTATDPVRLLDMRVGGNPLAPRLGTSCVEPLQITGANGVPSSGVTAVTINVTVVNPGGDGYVTAFPCGTPVPYASNVNYRNGQTVPNLVTVAVGASGKVCFYSSQQVHLVVDLAGWYASTGSLYNPLTPSRLLDTRSGLGAAGIGRFGVQSVYGLQVAGRGGVPANGATAVALNVTATDPTGDGYLTLYPCGGGLPSASNVNYANAQTVPNHVVVRLGTGGQVCIYTSLSTNVVVDLEGWYGASGSSFTPVQPHRDLDTRDGTGTGAAAMLGAIPASLQLHVLGAGGVPGSGVSAVTMNVTVTQATDNGFLTVWPCGAPMPTASNLNYTPGQTVANLVTVPVGAGGNVCFASYKPTHVVADVTGYFS